MFNQITTSLPVLTDSQLLTLCQSYGSQAKVWKQKFLGLLPEVNKRKLYEQKGFGSIFEFAAKLGGVSKEQVQRVLQLNQRFKAMPELQQVLTSGEVSIHKLVRVASVVTPDNQDFWINQSKLLSKEALETLVRDTKTVPGHSSNPNKTEKIPQSDELKLLVHTRQRLLELQNKGLNIDQMVNDLLDQREQNIQEDKKRVGEELKVKSPSSRYIPMKVKQVLAQEFGTKCVHDKCVNRSVNLHHTKRFSIDPSHNPIFLAPLCKSHHEIAHSVDIRVALARVSRTG